ncbi:MAG: tol-pal system protein YbgF, partial [Myxococcales bacterium]|nr:tol-pal system protein YbgF [Myxococcales bacterium]
YKRAYGLYRAGQGGAAESAFTAFVERFGTHDYADNALFWIGQVQFDEARFGAALATFHRVITEHPTGNKVPDALLMIGLTQAKLGRGAEGRETLARLRAMYPQTEAARKADDRLQPGKM